MGNPSLVTKQFTLIPLYDVFVSDLRFFMASGCDRSLPTFNAKSEIVFLWHKPDNQSNIEMEKFSLGRAEAKGITQFSWARKEVSTQANLKEPAVYFDETDLFTLTSVDILNKYIDMVPGPTTRYHFFLKKKETGPTGRPRFRAAGAKRRLHTRLTPRTRRRLINSELSSISTRAGNIGWGKRRVGGV